MRNLLFICIGAIVLLSVFSCDEWNSPELENVEEQAVKDLYSKRDSAKWAEEDKRHEENEKAYQKYLENLLAYKKTKHPIMFGWFNAWQPDGSGKYSKLSLIPDSMDVISIWGNWHSLTEDKIKELRSVQAKGTKVVIGWIIENIGDQIKWGRNNWPEDDNEAIVAYAKAIVDTIQKYGYDGFDYDYEPSYLSPFRPGAYQCGNLTSCYKDQNKDKELLFMKTMRELLGPDKLFHLNGSIDWLDPRAVQYFDRFVVQSYNSGAGTFEAWLSAIKQRLGVEPEQIVLCETFENQNALKRKLFIETYAQYAASKNGKIGGLGVYHINEDAVEDNAYINVRTAISVMNPTVNQ